MIPFKKSLVVDGYVMIMDEKSGIRECQLARLDKVGLR